MIFLREGGSYVKIEGPYDEVEALSGALKYKNPAAWHVPSYQLWLKTRKGANPQGWDGFIRPIKRMNAKTTVALRGWRDAILQACDDLKIEVDRGGLFRSPFATLEIEDIPDDIIAAKFELDDDQKTCVRDWLRSGIGINKVIVSGGKTACFCAAFAMIKRTYPSARALYFTPTERLLKQVVKEARGFLPDLETGQFGGGKHEKDAADLVVATTAILSRHRKVLEGKGWFQTFQVLLADESQCVTSTTLSKIIPQIPAIFRLGASDTTRDDDVLARNTILGLIGPRLHEIKAEGLIEKGRIAKPYIYMVDVEEWEGKYQLLNNDPPPDSTAFCLVDGEWKKATYVGPVYEKTSKGELRRDKHDNLIVKIGFHNLKLDGQEEEVESRWCLLDRAYDRAIIRFKERNELIGQWSKFLTEKYGQTLIICTRTAHIYILESVLQNYVDPDNIRVLFSKHSSAQRDAAFEWFKKNPKGILITPLVKVGVSINEIRGGIIADRVADWEYLNQFFGRMIRPKQGINEAHIVAFIDRQTPKFRLGCQRIYKKMKTVGGYTFFHPVTTPDSIPQAVRYDSTN